MKENKVEFKEIIEIFINRTISDLNSEREVPKINIVFKEEAFDLFYYVMNNPFQNDEELIPNLNEKDIQTLKKQNDINCPTIYVKDHMKFFHYLTEIVNNQTKLYTRYKDYRDARALSIKLMKIIWLRMGVSDFNNVEEFLKKQLEFIKNDIFNNYRNELTIENFQGYNITAQAKINKLYDETPLGMFFKIYDKDNKSYHSLPHIFYGIENDTCYIYAVQNDRNRIKIPKIERLLYKLNKGIENPNVHPSMVLSIMLFINILKENGITKIKIPTLQVLSYKYHEILSNNEKTEFHKKWDELTLNSLKYFSESEQEDILNDYEIEKSWYDKIVDKEDVISKLKTENLINLIYRIVENDDSLNLINDIDIDDSLIVKIKNKNIKF